VSRLRSIAWPLLVVALAAAVSGCAGHRQHRQAEIAAQLGNWDQAVLHLMEAVEKEPGNLRYQSALLRARVKASQAHFEKGKEYRDAGVLERALVELQQAVQLDPTNQYAENELAAVRLRIEARRSGHTPETLAAMKARTSGTRPQPPVLDPRSDEPISLDFPEPTPIFQIYKALGDAFGVNILFDQNLRDQEISISLDDVTAQTALETLMRAAGHFYKVIDPHTIIIAADTQQNRKLYEDLVIQTFFLSNVEVKDMMTILRTLIDSRRVAPNEQLNAIIIRDTADKVKVAERIIEANDKARAEVVVDVELLQIDTTRLRELGTQLSQYSVTQSLDTGNEEGGIRFSDLQFLNQSNWILTLPNFIYNFVKTSSNAQLLAQPQLRSSEGEKARAVIGDRVPIPVTTFNTSNTVGSNIVPITSFQYQDVGITIEVEPRVHHNQEITLKLRVEVSNISGFIGAAGGQQQPRIGTRSIESTIRLRDGETNMIAGLIRTDESDSNTGVPGLSDLPILGHLFGFKANDRSRTDLILTLTPHIVRQAEITAQDLLPIWVGTEQNITFRGGSPQLEGEAGNGPFEEPAAGTPEEIQEMMRQRLERLPRGLREGQEEPPADQPPAGTDLVPAPRDNLFDRPVEDEPDEEIFEPPPPEEIILEPPPDEGGDSAAFGASGRLGFDDDEAPPPFISPEVLAEAIALASDRRAGAAGQRNAGLAARTEHGEVLGEEPEAAGAQASGGEAAARVWLVPQRLRVEPGELFEVRLQASAVRPLSHLPLTLEFDPDVLAVERVVAGDFLGAAGDAEVLSDSSTPGRLVLGASRLGQRGGTRGAGTVARITFRAVAAGQSRVRFAEARALDALLEPLAPFATEPMTIEVGAAPPPRRPDLRGVETETEGERPRPRS
jgi:general secretion pathway protein D